MLKLSLIPICSGNTDQYEDMIEQHYMVDEEDKIEQRYMMDGQDKNQG